MAREKGEGRICDSPKNISLRTIVFELFGTFALVLIGVGTAATQPAQVHSIAAAFGLTQAALIYSTAFVGAGQLNPAITLALLCTSSISLAQALLNMFFQFVGGTAAAMFIKSFVDLGSTANSTMHVIDASGALGANHYIEDMVGQVFFAEVTGTFILCMVVICCAVNKSNTFAQTGTPLAVGFIVYALHIAMIPITSCGINPARSAGPSLVENMYTEQLYIFSVGPFTGALLAGLFGRFAFVVHDRVPGPGLDSTDEVDADKVLPVAAASGVDASLHEKLDAILRLAAPQKIVEDQKVDQSEDLHV